MEAAERQVKKSAGTAPDRPLIVAPTATDS
jgi:hypothetical protein